MGWVSEYWAGWCWYSVTRSRGSDFQGHLLLLQRCAPLSPPPDPRVHEGFGFHHTNLKRRPHRGKSFLWAIKYGQGKTGRSAEKMHCGPRNSRNGPWARAVSLQCKLKPWAEAWGHEDRHSLGELSTTTVVVCFLESPAELT